jgi:hypothetical protein
MVAWQRSSDPTGVSARKSLAYAKAFALETRIALPCAANTAGVSRLKPATVAPSGAPAAIRPPGTFFVGFALGHLTYWPASLVSLAESSFVALANHRHPQIRLTLDGACE